MKFSLVQINVSAGGIPKHPVESAHVGFQGVEGDTNLYRARKKNNAPDQALLVIPIEHLAALRAEGWRLEAGSLGENFTTRGIEYADVHIGDRFRVGEVEFEITRPCVPCKNLLIYGPGVIAALQNRRGWYARVNREGRVRAGDTIIRLNSR